MWLETIKDKSYTLAGIIIPNYANVETAEALACLEGLKFAMMVMESRLVTESEISV